MTKLTPEQIAEIQARSDAEARYKNGEPSSLWPHSTLCETDKDRQALLSHIHATAEWKKGMCPQCSSDTGLKYPRNEPPYCEDCGWPDEDFGEPPEDTHD